MAGFTYNDPHMAAQASQILRELADAIDAGKVILTSVAIGMDRHRGISIAIDIAATGNMRLEMSGEENEILASVRLRVS